MRVPEVSKTLSVSLGYLHARILHLTEQYLASARLARNEVPHRTQFRRVFRLDFVGSAACFWQVGGASATSSSHRSNPICSIRFRSHGFRPLMSMAWHSSRSVSVIVYLPGVARGVYFYERLTTYSMIQSLILVGCSKSCGGSTNLGLRVGFSTGFSSLFIKIVTISIGG